jgi:pyridoxal phosphate enzyme (YggS family)
MTTFQTSSSEAFKVSLEAKQQILARIGANLGEIRNDIALACANSTRSSEQVRLLAVSKTVGLAEIACAHELGIGDFGENRSSLLLERCTAMPEANWHFIGRIQTNKLKDIVGKACLIHSVASVRALLQINKIAAHLGITQRLLIEVNVSMEETKDGISAAELPELLDVAAGLTNTCVCGLMTMAPQNSPDVARATFANLRNLRDHYRDEYLIDSRVNLTELSMGMSEDYLIAIMEGATLVRIGRKIWR